MREPSGRGARGFITRGCLFAWLVLTLFGAGTGDVYAQAITRFTRDTGNINFVTTGGSLRNSPNTGSPCAVNSTSSQQLSGIPANRTIRNAYLYWGASGNSVDSTVTFNGANVTASRTFQRTFVNGGTSYNFYGGFADVTSRVSGNGNYTFGGLSVATGSPWCNSQAVVGGWALVVIYQGAGERLRAINVYDGLDYFYGSQVTLTPDGFRIPATNIDGRVAVFTLEGDPQNSESSGGFSEALRFNGTALDDGLVPTGSVPTTQQFDGTISTRGVITSYGIDVDQYDVGNLLQTGQTSATTVYSAGADLVLLMAQVVSATSDPAVNLGITVGHTGNFTAGQTGQYTITVSNAAGVEREDNTVTVSTTMPAGLTFNAASGTGWSCGASGQVVTCTHPPILNAGASFPPIALTVNVLESAGSSANLTATVSTPSYDPVPANNSATDPTSIVFPDLSTSTKTVQDLNGGEVAPGDTLRYTITVIESGGQATAGVSVTDHVPANVTFDGFVSLPPGAASSFSPPPNGDNDRGVITASGISIAANGSETVVFDVVVNAVPPGTEIDNQATVTNPNGPDASPAAPTLQVLPSQIPRDGTKQLYLWNDSQRVLTRTRPTGSHPSISLGPNGQSVTFELTPALQAPVTLQPGNFTANLLLTRELAIGNRTVFATLRNSVLGDIATGSVTFSSDGSPMRPIILNTPGVTAPAGSTFSLVVTNATISFSILGSVSLTPYSGSNYSRVDLNSASVINVDSVTTWDAAFNGGTAKDTYAPGETVFVRALISDPFGSFDISSARITVRDPNSNAIVNNQLMADLGAAANCDSTSSATCLFQYSFTLASSAPTGFWTVQVTGNEGVEGVYDIGIGTFEVALPQPALTVLKTSTVLSDPVNGTVNPKRIPNAEVRYDITITNSGPGIVDAGTLVITDAVPADAAMFVQANAVVFVDGAPPSGLSFSYPAHVTYSAVGPAGPWDHTPVPDANGFDPAVRAVRIAPAGVMNGAGSGNPSFTVQFRVRIN